MRYVFYIAFSFFQMFTLAQQKAGSIGEIDEILDTLVMPDEAKTVYKKLEGYRQRVLKGESMATLASLYTEDAGSAKTGGAYYGITKGMFVPEFENATWSLQKPGDISNVFETTYGFHFVQLIAKHGEAVDVRHILIKTNAK